VVPAGIEPATFRV